VHAGSRDAGQGVQRRTPCLDIAAFRVRSSPRPAAIASANSAGSFFGAMPRSLTSTIAETARRPSAAMQRAATSALASVSVRSDA
jgi:hypothetical protein